MTISTENFISVGVGATANDGTGDELRTAFTKVNNNFSNISTIGFVAANIDVTGSIEADGNITTTAYINGNVIASSLDVTGDIDATGNITVETVYANTYLLQSGADPVTGFSGNMAALEVLGNLIGSGNVIVSNTYVPSSNSSVGTAGQIVWDDGHVYICVDTDTWKRANLSTW